MEKKKRLIGDKGCKINFKTQVEKHVYQNILLEDAVRSLGEKIEISCIVIEGLKESSVKIGNINNLFKSKH